MVAREQLVSYHGLCLVETALDTGLPADLAAMFSYVFTTDWAYPTDWAAELSAAKDVLR